MTATTPSRLARNDYLRERRARPLDRVACYRLTAVFVLLATTIALAVATYEPEQLTLP
jgi:hypothetical protein